MQGFFHERLDVDRWIEAFPLAHAKEFFRGAAMSGPGEVAMVEQIKRKANSRGLPLGKSIPIDLCVWEWGEGACRQRTRIGGLPYRPAGQPWPTSDEGEPLTFVAQFCFSDSRDIRSSLPGDILLIFGSPHFGDLEFEWQAFTDQPLIQHEEIPRTGWTIQPCAAVLFRTQEYPEADLDKFDNEFPLNSWARGGAGSKIGGFVKQYDYSIHLEEELAPGDETGPEHLWALGMIEKQRNRGPLLCRLESIHPGPRWPFVNMAQASWRWSHDANLFLIHDAGAIDIYLNAQGELSFDVSSG
jgi:hypothetical protein